MARSSLRAFLRRQRQKINKMSLPIQKTVSPQAAQQFVIFGGKKGKSKGRSLESFIKQYELSGQEA